MIQHQDKFQKESYESLIFNRKHAGIRTVQLQDNRLKTTTEKQFQDFQNRHNSQPIQLSDKRPSFTADSTKSAVLHHNTSEEHKFQIDEEKPGLPDLNAAQPHRFSWKDIRDNTNKFHKGGSRSDFDEWTSIFVGAGEERIAKIQSDIARSQLSNQKTKARLQKKLLKRAQGSHESFKAALDAYLKNKNNDTKKEFLRQANSFHANVPDYGPHRGVNNPVREAMHLHFLDSKTRKTTKRKRPRSPSPMSRRLMTDLDPSRLSAGIAFTEDGRIISSTGVAIPISDLQQANQKRIARFPKKVIKSYDESAAFGSKYIKQPSRKRRKKNSSPKKKK